MERFAVWKYAIGLGRTYVEMPAGAVVVHCHEQDGNLCIWAGVNPNAPKTARVFEVIGTGQTQTHDEQLHYIGTAHMNSGALVWHVFEVVA